MKKLAILIFCIFNFSSYAQEWQCTYGPAANDILSFASFNNKLFIGTYNGTFYSENNGLTWKKGSITGMVRSFAVCSSKIFAAASFGNYGPNGFYSSMDGINWQRNDNLNFNESLNMIVEGNNFYMSEYSKILFSSNCGTTWKNIGLNLPNGEVNGMIKLDQTIYLTKSFFNGNTDTVYSSSDTGHTWMAHPILINDGWLWRMATDGNHLFIATGIAGVLISSDKGNSWQNISNGLPAGISVEDLNIQGQTMYASTRSGIYQCTIGTYSWTLKSLPDKFVAKLFFSGQDWYAGTNGDGLFKSSNGGTTWQQITNGIYAGKQISNLANSGTDLWAAGSGSGLYKSPDHGNTWSKINIQGFTSLYIDGNNIYGGDFNEGGIWVSHNSGASFSKVSIPGSYRFYYMTGNSSAIYANDNIQGKLYKSIDKGTSWNIVTGLPNVISVFADGNIVYAGTENGLYRSTNGTTWQSCIIPQTATNINSFAKIANTIFCISDLGILRSSDGGINWNATVNNGFPPNSYRSLLTAVNSNLYVNVFEYGDHGGEIPHGVYTSSDGGDTWTEKNTGLNELEVNCLHEHNSMLFGGISYGGVFKFNPGISTALFEIPDPKSLIFPNPTTSTFTIISANNEPMQITIYNTLGKKILEQTINQKEEIVNLSNQDKGIYFIEIVCDGKKEREKIVLN